jgi:hypothetical protein
MHTTIPSRTEVDAWISVLLTHGHLHRACIGPGAIWTVQRTSRSRPRTLHGPVLAMDHIVEILTDLRPGHPDSPQ